MSREKIKHIDKKKVYNNFKTPTDFVITVIGMFLIILRIWLLSETLFDDIWMTWYNNIASEQCFLLLARKKVSQEKNFVKVVKTFLQILNKKLQKVENQNAMGI